LSREVLVVLLGDLHAGSTIAPGVEYTDQDGGRHPLSLTRLALNAFLSQALKDTKVAAKGCDIVFCPAGDLVDGDRHHGTHQTLGTVEEQVEWATELLQPWADIAADAYGLRGTEAHVGKNGVLDRSVCDRLGIPHKQFWRLSFGGKVLDWAHHATGSRKPWLSSSAPVALANKTYYEYLERGEQRPSLIARHHMHYPNRVLAKEIYVMSVPGWQAQTDYSYMLDPNGLMAVGLGFWWPARNEVKVQQYEWPAEAITEVRLGTEKRNRKAAVAR
jgi:hypothetical protein